MPAPAQTSTAAIVAAGRHLLERRGADALTMREVADAVGVRTPSLYKRVRSRADLLGLIVEAAADELTAAFDRAANSGDPVTDLRALMNAYRRFAHANPVMHTLLFTPQGASDPTARSERTSATLLRLVTGLAGPRHALPAARTIVAWAHGFITMELTGAFMLGGDVEEAWEFGLDRLLTAVRVMDDARPSPRG